jgi:hypothetical protein
MPRNFSGSLPTEEELSGRLGDLVSSIASSDSCGEHIMAEPSDKSGSKDVEGPQDPLVERLRPEPSRSPVAGVTLNGLLGDSDRTGFRRLYLTVELNYFVEFSVEDVVDSSLIPPDKAPFAGHEATQITLKKGAEIAYTHTMAARSPDEFDLDLRRGRRRLIAPGPETGGTAYSCYECDTDLRGQCWTQGWLTCTCANQTCDTCYNTGCNMHTCESTCTGCLPTDNTNQTLSCIETACTPPCPRF